MQEYNDITSNDLDDQNIDSLSDDWIILAEQVSRKIIFQAKDPEIRGFLAMKQEWVLDLQPEYQRNFVMNKKQASRLVESVLMDVPLPVIYLSEEQDWTFSVIDGQQRLTSLLSFVEGRFPGETEDFSLTGLTVLRELNKKRFIDLSKEQQNKIRSTTLHTIEIKRESNEDIKFEIFERLNTGSIKLNEDEIRNTVYRWPYINLLAELAENDLFDKLVRKSNFKNRMIYRGMILRFFAISERSYLNYVPSIKQFTNKHLREFQFLSSEKQKELREKFKNTLDLVNIVFWENSFRRYEGWNAENPNGTWWVSVRINMAIFDIQMCSFANFSKNQIVQHADIIRETFIDLMCNNEKFKNSILIETSNREQVHTRFKIWMEVLEKIAWNPISESRIFPYNVKVSLYGHDKTCKICGQQILSIDDSEVDHILPYSHWWKTEIDNAQITHRYCNRRKNNHI